jgi:DNA-binding LytR/AlgR family response regulator
MNVLIVEDEKLAADELEELIHQYNPAINIVAKLDSVQATIDWLCEFSADLIFLDIHLSDDNSFTIFEKIDVKTPIVFVTAYDEYALQAFSINSIDYLLKPIDFTKLSAALTKMESMRQEFAPDFSKLISVFRDKEHIYQKRFMVHSGDKILSVPDTEVAYFFAHQRYVVLHTIDNQQYVVDYTLERLEQILDPHHFFRINRKFVVCFTAIKAMFPYSKGRIKIDVVPEPKEDAIVSVDKATKFKQWLNA